MCGSQNGRTEVLIIGAGPVGLALVAELCYRKVNCTLVEKHLTTTDLPKSFNLTFCSMEYFRRLGISEWLSATNPTCTTSP